MTQTVPIQMLAAEWNTTVEALITELGPDRVLTDALEIRHVSVSDAEELLARRRAEAARHRGADEERQAQAAQQFSAQQARLQAIQRHQAVLRANDPGLDAYATMLANDADSSGRQGAAGRAFDEVFAAQQRGDIGVFTRLSPPPQEATP